MTKNTAGVLVALITALGGLGAAALSLKTSSEKSDMTVVKASYETLARQVNKLSDEMERLHDHVYGVRHSAGGEPEPEYSEACPPYDLGVDPKLDAGTPAPAPPPAPVKKEPEPLQLQRVPTFEQMMQQQGL